MKRVAQLASALSLTCLVAAQAREPLFGRVLDADGEPLGGATVTLVEDDLDLVGIDPVDVLTVTCDKRGRFAAQALRGVFYSAIAEAGIGDGRAMVSKPVANLACGSTAELRADVVGHARRVQLPDLGHWGDAAQLRVRLRWPHCPGHHVDLPIDDRGGIDVPASSVVANAFLVDLAGRRFGRIWIPPSDDRGDASIPEARSIDVVVVDEAGRPVAGATVEYVGRESHTGVWGLISYEHFEGMAATTDDQGRAALRVEMWGDPFEEKPDTHVFVAHAQGHGEGAAGWLNQEAFADGRVIEGHEGRCVRISLPGREQLERERAPQALAHHDLRLFAMGTVSQNRGDLLMHHYLPRSYGVRVADDGSWDTGTAVVTATQFALRVPPIDGKPVLLQSGSSPNMVSTAASELAPLAIQLLDAGGRPVGSAHLLVVPQGAGTLDFWHAVPLAPDQDGRIDVLLQRGAWSVIAMDETAWASAEVEQWPPEELKLRLEAKPSRAVRVLDHEGKPVQGARFEPGSFRSGRAGRGVDRVLAELGWNTLGMHVRRATTDENGEARIYYLPWPGTQPTVFAWLGSFATATEEAALGSSDEWLELRLRQ